MPSVIKQCRKCGEDEKHYASFPWSCVKCIKPNSPENIRKNRLRYQSRNQEWTKQYQKFWQENNKDHVQEYRKKNRERDSKNFRRWRLQAEYGITEERYLEMLQEQNHTCAICRQPENGKWHIDHCHKTGKVRGVLCRTCNPMIGMAKESTDILKAAITYLEKHKWQ